MRRTLNRRIPPSTRTHSILRWSRNFFLVVGVLILGYCGYVLLDAKVYQAYQTRHFEQQIKDFKSDIPSKDRVQNVSFQSSAGEALGEIELTRVGVTAM